MQCSAGLQVEGSNQERSEGTDQPFVCSLNDEHAVQLLGDCIALDHSTVMVDGSIMKTETLPEEHTQQALQYIDNVYLQLKQLPCLQPQRPATDANASCKPTLDPRRNKRQRCSKCGNAGHKSRTCTFEPAHVEDKDVDPRKNKMQRCSACGTQGHKLRTCTFFGLLQLRHEGHNEAEKNAQLADKLQQSNEPDGSIKSAELPQLSGKNSYAEDAPPLDGIPMSELLDDLQGGDENNAVSVENITFKSSSDLTTAYKMDLVQRTHSASADTLDTLSSFSETE
mmetsp:Transcript_44824/g.74391  ORF Transcript_44824/g.74391 Transcript_44824/m.74391 type:complete len:282 (+) Transcript_44824:64-909(+)